MCERTENQAVAILARHLQAWRATGLNPHDFTEDLAIEALLAEGVRPSALSADLEWLMNRAFRASLRSPPCPPRS